MILKYFKGILSQWDKSQILFEINWISENHPEVYFTEEINKFTLKFTISFFYKQVWKKWSNI